MLTPGTPTISAKPTCEGMRTYTYVYTDCEGNTQDWVFTYTIEYEQQITIFVANAGMTVDCPNDTDTPPALPTVIDNCGNMLTPGTPTISAKPTCEGTRMYTYVYTDCEGNSQDWVYTYTVEYEPFANPTDAGMTVDCPDDTDTPPALPTVTDNCGNVLTPGTPTISAKPTCEGTRTYTYVYTDCEGNTQDWVFTYMIEYETFANPTDAGMTVDCPNDTDTAPALPTVTDNCGNVLTPGAPTISAKPTCEGTRMYTYVYTDCEGNSQDWVYTYTVEYEEFANPMDAGMTVDCPNDTDTPPALPTVTDNCGNVLTPGTPAISAKQKCEGMRTYTYVYTDCEGNTQDWVFTYTIEYEPFANPTDAGMTVDCPNDTDTPPALPTVTDNCGNVLTPGTPTISAKPTCEGMRTYTYVYTDCEGNTQDWVYTYTVEYEPFANPTDAGLTVDCPNDTDTPPALPTVTDNCGNVLTPGTPTISAKPTCEGTRIYTYVYTDCEGNTQDWVYTYTVEYEPFANPTDAGLTVDCPNDTDTPPALPTVTDNCGNVLTPGTPTISAKPTCEGTRTYTYVYTDCEGNTQDWV
ncbi:MAG: hypothetical protein IPN33_23930 [Saprospiraceae bacterium]|nr:hypothetical protein [Saprospiraceae bacterium]